MLDVLASTVLIDYLRGRPAVAHVAALRERGDVPCTTAVNVEEIVRGVRAKEVPAVETLFSGLRILGIGHREGWQAGRWRQQFSARGLTLWQADCLVAAAAVGVAARLATGNPKDFPMPELTVEHWGGGRLSSWRE